MKHTEASIAKMLATRKRNIRLANAKLKYKQDRKARLHDVLNHVTTVPLSDPMAGGGVGVGGASDDARVALARELVALVNTLLLRRE
jgi:hypothetical protein